MGLEKWNWDKEFFKEINTNEKAYWFGFIMGDGYIIDNRNSSNSSNAMGLRIRLCESDKSLLEKLNKDIKYDKPIKIVKNYGNYENQQNLAEFLLSSTEIVDDLENLGLTSGNKSCNEFLPNFSDKNLTKNFILGLFDADGCVSLYNSWSKRDKKYKECYEWQIVSSEDILNKIHAFLTKEINDIQFQKITKNNNKKNNDLYRLKAGSKNTIKKLYEYFYLNECSNSYLDRKYNKMKEIFNK